MIVSVRYCRLWKGLVISMVILAIGAFAGALFWIQRWLYMRMWNRSLDVKIEFEDEMIVAGEKTTLLEVIENRKWLPLASLKVKFQCSKYLQFADGTNSAVTDKYYRSDLFHLLPYRRVTRRHEIVCPKRGYYGIYGIDLLGTDLFLHEEMIESRRSAMHIYVIPTLFVTNEIVAAVQKMNGEVASKRHLLSDPFTYLGIREYTPVDEVRSINWKASAKSEELKVNIRDYTTISAIRIYLNLEDTNILKKTELLEYSISIAAYLSDHFLSQGVGVSLYANAPDCISKSILSMGESKDKGHMRSIYRALARLDLSVPAFIFSDCFEEQLMKSGDGLLTVFISPDQQDHFQTLLKNYSQKHEFLWLLPVYHEKEAQIQKEILNRAWKIPCQ